MTFPGFGMEINGSLSARRAWIEIFVPFDVIRPAMSLSARRAWIEMNINGPMKRGQVSLSARRAWIEMCDVSLNYKEVLYVALRKESVDRN